MASPDQERMDAISGALARLLERQSNLDARLVRVEAALGLTAAPEPVPARAEPPPLPLPEIRPPPIPEAAPAFAPPSAPEPCIETRFGLGWSTRVGAGTLLIRGGLFFQ